MDEQYKRVLERRLEILKEEMKVGRVYFAKGMQVVESLKRVRYGPGGRIDLSTVDGLVRATALAVSEMRMRQEIKKVPLKRTQEEYFGFVESIFSHPYAEMVKHKVTPHDIARHMANKKNIVQALCGDSEQLWKTLKEYWDTFGVVITTHLEDTQHLRGVYGGDIFPSYTRNIVSGTGLYLDTVVLPDPLLRALALRTVMKPEQFTYLLVKHGVSLLRYKELALADVDPPIVVIAPDSFHLEESTRDYVAYGGKRDLLLHLGTMFGRQFKDEAHLLKFLGTLKSVDSLVKKVKKPDRFLLDVDWQKLSIKERIAKYRQEMVSKLQGKPASVGVEVQMMFSGRMIQINDAILKAKTLNGTVLMDAPTSWQYLLWKYQAEYLNTKEVIKGASPDFVANALASPGKDLNVLTGLPDDVLIKLRKEGALQELRAIIRKGTEQISSVSEDDFQKTASQVTDNLKTALSKHSAELETLKQRHKKYFGLDVTPFVSCAGIAIAAVACSNIILSVIAAIAGMAGAPSAKDLIKTARDLIREGKGLSRSPIGILFQGIERTRKRSA